MSKRLNVQTIAKAFGFAIGLVIGIVVGNLTNRNK